MDHYDAIVIGAGPAGATAAYALARAGARVALLEKQIIPRHKTCGGGVPIMLSSLAATEEFEGLSPDLFVESYTRFMRHTWKFDDPLLAPINPEGCEEKPLAIWMVQRSRFDEALARRAAAAGAELRDGLPVRALELPKNGPALIRAQAKDGATWEGTADTVIGADGANGVTARAVGLRKDRTLAIAIEVEAPHCWGEGHEDLRPEVAHLEYGAVERGYAWVFPKGDHLNVGAGVFRPRRADGRGDGSVREELQKAILDYLKMLGVPKSADELTFHAHPLPIWDGMERLQTRDNRVLLAGDAAGLINPFFGDGILHAIRSGRIAAASVLAGDQAGYSRAISAEFKSNFDAALRLARFFYQWPGVCYRYGVKRPMASRTAASLLCGSLHYDEVAKRAMSWLKRALKSDPTATEAA